MPAPNDRREAEAWIRFLRLKHRQAALEKLQVNAGDIVRAIEPEVSEPEEVSSIGSDGRIYYKGGSGKGAWPDMVTIQCRKDDNSAAALRFKRAAANLAALRSRANLWSESKQREVQGFDVTATPLTPDTVEQLEVVIDSARDEKPIQKFMKRTR
jgi:hypothetical protein